MYFARQEVCNYDSFLLLVFPTGFAATNPLLYQILIRTHRFLLIGVG